MTKAIYARVSSNKQDIESQEPDLKAWEKSQTQPVKWFTETVSGKAAKRPVWDQVHDLIRTRKIADIPQLGDLKRLDLRDTAVTPAGVDRLRRLLPNWKIEVTP